MRRAGLQKVRLKERRDIGAAVTIAQRPTFGQKRRFDHASAASGLAQQPDILSVPRHVSKVPNGDIATPTRNERGRQLRRPYSFLKVSPVNRNR
jgi:hypothetical protein